MVLGKLDIHMQKYETGGLSYTTHKEKWNRLKTKTWSYKNPKKKISEKISWHHSWQWYIGYGTESLSNKSISKQIELQQT